MIPNTITRNNTDIEAGIRFNDIDSFNSQCFKKHFLIEYAHGKDHRDGKGMIMVRKHTGDVRERSHFQCWIKGLEIQAPKM